MYEELNYLLPITSDVKKMQEQREQLAVMGFFGALGPEYDAVRSQILGGNTMASLTETFSRIVRVSRESSKDISPIGDNSALAVQGNQDGGRGHGGGRSGRGFSSGGSGRGFDRGQPQSYSGIHGDTESNTELARTCHYCGMPGHIQRFCYKLHGRPLHSAATNIESSIPSQSSEGGTLIRMSEDELARYNQFQISQPVSSSTATFAQIGNATACLSSTSRPWVNDSGVTDHMTGSLGFEDEEDDW